MMTFTLVSIGPGAIQLNLIPYLAHSDAKDLVIEEQNILQIHNIYTLCVCVYIYIYIYIYGLKCSYFCTNINPLECE